MRVKVTNDLHCGRSRSRGRGGHRCCWYYCWRATVMKLSCSPMASLPGRGQCVWLVVCLVQMKAWLITASIPHAEWRLQSRTTSR